MEPSPPYGTPEWLEWRRGGIGASEMPTVAGVNQYQGEYALVLLKRGLAPPFEGNAATRWGHRIERVGIEIYTEETGRPVTTDMQPFIHPRWPHVYATLDGRVGLTGPIGVEVKATQRWDTPPPMVLVQCYAQMGAADLEAVDVVRLSMHGEPVITRIERDEQAVTDLMDLGEAWYVRYVLGDEMPPVDGSRETSRYLDSMPGYADFTADINQASMAHMLREVRAAMRLAEQTEARLVNELKDSMMGGYSLTGTDFHVSWKPTKDRTKVDWKAVALALAGGDSERLGAAVAEHTTTEPGTRPFRVVFQEEES